MAHPEGTAHPQVAAHPRGRVAVDPSLYLVTDTGLCGGPDGVVRVVAAAVRGGVTVVQLRWPGAADDELVALGRRLVALLRPLRVPLIVNDRVDLVDPIDADGAHVGQDDLDPVAARDILGADRHLGLSTHSEAEIAAAAALGPVVDLVGVGPVWATTTKPGHAPPLGPEAAARLVAASRLPCVLIGGIDVDRLPGLTRQAAGIAVVSAICASPDPEAAARALRAAWSATPLP